MPKMKKRTPVKSPPEMERAVQQIYDDINEIINAVNSVYSSSDIKLPEFIPFQGDETSGKPGDIRIVSQQEQTEEDEADVIRQKNTYINYKTEDGWYQIKGTKIERQEEQK